LPFDFGICQPLRFGRAAINNPLRPLNPRAVFIVAKYFGGSTVSVRSAEAIALPHLYAIAEATRLRGDGDVEVRWVAVPQTWKPLTAVWGIAPIDKSPFGKDRSRSHDAVIRVYDDAGNVIETHEHAGEFKEP
jgi:hypothetical protein